MGGSWVGDFWFAIWVLECWSCVSVVTIWVSGFRFARRLLAVGLSWVCSSWVWVYSPWVWVLFVVGLGFAWWRPWVAFSETANQTQKLPPRHRHTSHLYHMTHTSQNFHHTTHTAHNLHNPPISTMPTLICTPYINPKRRSPLQQRQISTPQMPIFKQPNPKHQSRHHPLICNEREKEEREEK